MTYKRRKDNSENTGAVTPPRSSLIEQRLQKALLYKGLLDKSLVSVPEGGNVELAKVVEDEVKAMINERLEILLGAKPEPAAEKRRSNEIQVSTTMIIGHIEALREQIAKNSAAYSAEETAALKALARATLNKPQATSPTNAPEQQHAPVAERKYVEKTLPDGKKVKLDVTGQVTDTDGRLPMATPDQVASFAMTHTALVRSDPNVSGLMDMLQNGVQSGGNAISDFSVDEKI